MDLGVYLNLVLKVLPTPKSSGLGGSKEGCAPLFKGVKKCDVAKNKNDNLKTQCSEVKKLVDDYCQDFKDEY